MMNLVPLSFTRSASELGQVEMDGDQGFMLPVLCHILVKSTDFMLWVFLIEEICLV